MYHFLHFRITYFVAASLIYQSGGGATNFCNRGALWMGLGLIEIFDFPRLAEFLIVIY